MTTITKQKAGTGKKVIKTKKVKQPAEVTKKPYKAAPTRPQPKGRRVPDGPCAFPGTEICPLENPDKAQSPYPYQKGCRNAACKAANSAYYTPWREKKRAEQEKAAKRAAKAVKKAAPKQATKKVSKTAPTKKTAAAKTVAKKRMVKKA